MSHRKVPFFYYPGVFSPEADEFIDIFKDVCSRGAYIMQKELTEFEDNLAKYVGAKYALGVSNGTDAIWMGLIAAGMEHGDEAIFSSHTFVATAAAIHFAGGIPIAAECGEDHEIDPEDVRRKITPKTKFLVPTQLNGRCCNMDELQKIADEHNLIIVEDSAQALGSKFKGRCAGTFGAAGTLSFYPAKVMGTFGDAGAVFTNDKDIYKKLKLLRDHGRCDETGEVLTWGMNYRMDNIHAAFLNHKLKSYDSVMARRREIASIYNNRLASVSQLVLPPSPADEGDYYDIYQNYEIRAENRDGLKQFLGDNGIGTLVQWGGDAVHHFKRLKIEGNLPFTDKVIASMLLVPINMTISNEDVNYVCDKIIAFYGAL